MIHNETEIFFGKSQTKMWNHSWEVSDHSTIVARKLDCALKNN